VRTTVRSADGTTIAVEAAGDGDPVVLVDGGFGSRAFPSAVAGLLSHHASAVRYDRRGRHESGDAAEYAIAREVEDLAAVLGAVGGRAAVFGMSSGACLALDGAQAGLPITRLALYEPPIVVDATRPPLPNDFVETLRRLVANGRRGDAVEYMLTTAVGVPGEAVAGVRQDPAWAELEAVAHTLPYDAAIQFDLMRGTPLPADRWDRVTQPVLVVDGDASPAWARNGAAALADLLPAARRASLPGQTHDVDATVLVPVLVDFLT
jgi:pimeloyl-ACP methyl ester carboxylesterase